MGKVHYIANMIPMVAACQLKELKHLHDAEYTHDKSKVTCWACLRILRKGEEDEKL